MRTKINLYCEVVVGIALIAGFTLRTSILDIFRLLIFNEWRKKNLNIQKKCDQNLKIILVLINRTNNNKNVDININLVVPPANLTSIALIVNQILRNVLEKIVIFNII